MALLFNMNFNLTTINHFFQKRFTILFFLTAIVSIISWLFSFVPIETQEHLPTFFWISDLLSHWQFFYFVFALFCMTYLTNINQHRRFLVTLIISTPFFYGIYQHFPYNRFLNNKDEVKIIFANIHFDAVSLGKIEELIISKTPDIIALVETSSKIAPALEHTSKLYDYALITQYHEGGVGYAVLSKKYLNFKKPIAEMTQDTVTFIGQKNGKTIAFNLIHYLPPISTTAKKLREQAAQTTANILKKQINEYDYVLLAGDFNATIWSTPLKLFTDLDFISTTYFKPTWPNIPYLPGIGIDHLFIPKKLIVRESFVFDMENHSDHKAIYNSISISP